jgi:hypothetical protein
MKLHVTVKKISDIKNYNNTDKMVWLLNHEIRTKLYEQNNPKC